MSGFAARDPDFAARVAASFARQRFMSHIGADLTRVEPGAVHIALHCRPELFQQHDFVHGGAVAAIADSAGGYAALTLADAGEEVLTVEFKVNFCAPATGERLRAEGRVLRPGRTLVLTETSVYAGAADGAETLCAKMQQTMMRQVMRGEPASRTRSPQGRTP